MALKPAPDTRPSAALTAPFEGLDAPTSRKARVRALKGMTRVSPEPNSAQILMVVANTRLRDRSQSLAEDSRGEGFLVNCIWTGVSRSLEP